MVSIYELKPRFQNLLRPLTQSLVSKGVTANQVTVAAMLLSLASGGAVAMWPSSPIPMLLIPVVLFVRMALNAIDGMIAREHNMKSNLGTFLNELGDVFSDSALYLPLALVPGIHPILPVVCVLFAVITEMTGVVAVQIGAARRYDGPMGKSDRAFVFGAIYLALGTGIAPPLWVNVLLAIILLLLLWTIANRTRRALALMTMVPERSKPEGVGR